MTPSHTSKSGLIIPRPTYNPTDPLLSAREAAVERGQALSTFWRDLKLGRVPQPYYVSPRCPRWRLSEIRASVEATRRTSGRAGA